MYRHTYLLCTSVFTTNKLVKLPKSSASKGSDSFGSGVAYCCTNSPSNKYVGTLSYEIEKGAYYTLNRITMRFA